MCGIAGICCLNGSSPLSLEGVMEMLSVQHHRGPDESGVYLDDRVALGHNRLSIIDLHGGTQPIHNESQTLWISYNGEVFNYIELKRDLLKSGHRFTTETDTEVILHLYEDKGPACIDDLNGQFAFAIWNSKDKELLLARDRVGIRPLYYTLHKGHLIFASEIKSIFTIDEIAREIDPIGLDQVFTFWTTLSGHTIFKNIHELPPGHYLKASNGTITIHKYWDVPFYSADQQYRWSSEELCDAMLELIMDSIRIRLRSDVPVGCYLSGGLDSSGVTALVKKDFNNRLKTFGIRFEEADFDETEYQDQMVRFLGTDHTAVEATNNRIGSSFPVVLWHCEKPLLRTSPVPLFMLSKVVRDNGYKVVLTGEGADEVFGGYNIFREAKVRKFWAAQPDSKIRPLLIGRLYPYIFKDPRFHQVIQRFFASGLDKTDDPFFSHHIRWQNMSKTKLFFSEELKEAIKDYSGYDELKAMLPERFGKSDCLTKAQYLEMSVFLSNYLLSSQGDRVAMAHSVEIRLPYLDYRIIDFMGRVPPMYKIFGLNEKYLLKKIYRRILPESIIRRHKHPYRAPIGQSLLSGQCYETERALSDSLLAQAGMFHPARVGALLKKFRSGRQPSEVDNMALAGILSSQLIFDQFVVRFPHEAFRRSYPNLVIDRRTGRSDTSVASVPKMSRKGIRDSGCWIHDAKYAVR